MAFNGIQWDLYNGFLLAILGQIAHITMVYGRYIELGHWDTDQLTSGSPQEP